MLTGSTGKLDVEVELDVDGCLANGKVLRQGMDRRQNGRENVAFLLAASVVVNLATPREPTNSLVYMGKVSWS